MKSRSIQRDLFLFVALEIAVTVWAIVVFKNVPVKKYAALLAATGFLSQSVFMFWRMRLWQRGLLYLTFWANTVHLGVSTLPLIYTYLTNWNEGFHRMMIWGMPGPVFHIMSEKIFVVLMVATLVDIVRVQFLDLKTKKPRV